MRKKKKFGRILTWPRSFALSDDSFSGSSLDRLARFMNDLIRSPGESWAGGPLTLWFALGESGAVTGGIRVVSRGLCAK